MSGIVFCLLFLWVSWAPLSAWRDICFHVVTASYNNEQYCIKNIEMMARQSYTHWHMIIVNDCSTDATGSLIQAYIDEHHLHDKVLLINNSRNCGPCRNIDDAIRGSQDIALHGRTIPACPDNRVVVIYDGDDTWTAEHSLARIAQEYQDPEVWMTYGQFRIMPGGQVGWCCEFPREVRNKGTFRAYSTILISTHPKTCKAWLYKRIRPQDLIDARTKTYFRITGDMAIMFPMLEMAAPDHIRYIPDVIYDYNGVNPLSDWRVYGSAEQVLVANMIRKMPQYQPIERPKARY